MEALASEVRRLGDILGKSPPASAEDLLEALGTLQSIGSLPTEVLSATRIGLTTGRVSKDCSKPEEVRIRAKGLVEAWRQDVRRWRAAASGSADEETHLATSLAGQRKRQREASCSSASSAPLRSIGSSPPDPEVLEQTSPQRERVRQKLSEALSHASDEAQPLVKDGTTVLVPLALKQPLPVADRLAAEIEAALCQQLRAGREYGNQARSLIFNLKDPANHDFRVSVLSGTLEPKSLPQMSSEEMASQAKTSQRAKMRKESFEATALKPPEESLTDRFTCDRCQGTETSYSQSTAVESCVRSGGEPVETLVTFVTCMVCGHRWTQRSGFA
ncbi:unnamed protein product [Polarella glacialis]|uniref:Transcription elongation factor TFIIS n=1 Tax=Polarella glacialis TaxID=89957 RepID=A0A813HKI0_POLGL|nr:unnamed protein product [Polarella glacialis]